MRLNLHHPWRLGYENFMSTERKDWRLGFEEERLQKGGHRRDFEIDSITSMALILNRILITPQYAPPCHYLDTPFVKSQIHLDS